MGEEARPLEERTVTSNQGLRPLEKKQPSSKKSSRPLEKAKMPESKTSMEHVKELTLNEEILEQVVEQIGGTVVRSL